MRVSTTPGLDGGAFYHSSVLPMLSGLLLLRCSQLEPRMSSRKACSLSLDTRSDPTPICTLFVAVTPRVPQSTKRGVSFLLTCTHAATARRAPRTEWNSSVSLQRERHSKVKKKLYRYCRLIRMCRSRYADRYLVSASMH